MPLRRMAVFVEGQTEVIFLSRLFLELAGRNRIILEKTSYRNLQVLRSTNIVEAGEEYYILIVNCENDEAVKSRVLEERASLISNNFELILGLRDLFPIPRSDLPRVLRHLRTRVPTAGIQIEICLAVMETESWFLQEENHYPLIDPALTVNYIYRNLGFHVINDDAEDIDAPAELLRDIYRLAGKSYRKTKIQVERTVNALDFDNLYINLRQKLPYFDSFLVHVDQFLR